MNANWDKLNQGETPEMDTISVWVDTNLWEELLQYMDETYQAKPLIEYSGCGMAPGWNVKFRKAGKGLCTLYPEQGWFTVLVVIGQKEKAEMEMLLPALSDYTRELYNKTKEGMGQRWLMFAVRDSEVLADVKSCIAIRRKPK